MNIRDYQVNAMRTAIYPGQRSFQGLTYAVLGLNGESGEVSEQVKKAWRDDQELTPERREAVIKELGDCCWYLAAVATELDVSLDEVAKKNLEKLSDRKNRGVISGSGDER